MQAERSLQREGSRHEGQQPAVAAGSHWAAIQRLLPRTGTSAVFTILRFWQRLLSLAENCDQQLGLATFMVGDGFHPNVLLRGRDTVQLALKHMVLVVLGLAVVRGAQGLLRRRHGGCRWASSGGGL